MASSSSSAGRAAVGARLAQAGRSRRHRRAPPDPCSARSRPPHSPGDVAAALAREGRHRRRLCPRSPGDAAAALAREVHRRLRALRAGPNSFVAAKLSAPSWTSAKRVDGGFS
jgi:hypothetical protein